MNCSIKRCYLFPLPDIAIHELFKYYSSTMIPNIEMALYLLPDSARLRINDIANDQTLQYNYVIIRKLECKDNIVESICWYITQLSHESINSRFKNEHLEDEIILNSIIVTNYEGKPHQNLTDRLFNLDIKLINNLSQANQSIDNSASDFSAISNSATKNSGMDILFKSNLCRWRACLNETSSTCLYGLCESHNEIKCFLDSSKNNILNSAKFLPPNLPKNVLQTLIYRTDKIGNQLSQSNQFAIDVMIIKQSSNLLQELWDKKLTVTLKAFVNRSIADMNLKTRLEVTSSVFERLLMVYFNSRQAMEISSSSKKKSIQSLKANSKFNANSTPPISQIMLTNSKSILNRDLKWSQWKSTELLLRTKQFQESNLEILYFIHELERNYSSQLAELQNSDIINSIDLSILKKDAKKFKDSLELQYLSTNAISPSMFPSDAQNNQNVQLQSKQTDGFTKLNLVIDDSLTSNLAFEQKLCDKKILTLSSRIQDEIELKASKMRKELRLKAIQDKQAKDPRNFKNQGTRF